MSEFVLCPMGTAAAPAGTVVGCCLTARTAVGAFAIEVVAREQTQRSSERITHAAR